MNTDLRDSYGTTETNLMPDVEAVEISEEELVNKVKDGPLKELRKILKTCKYTQDILFVRERLG